jgi:hydroxymethylpyrimidine pyrophosphatase-like HAD family hydrolase
MIIMSEIYLYDKTGGVRVLENRIELEKTRFKLKWLRFVVEGLEFELETTIEKKTIILERIGRFAIYRDEIIELNSVNKRVLLVSDLDKTLRSSFPPAMSMYYSFIKFWIANCEFNSSVLIYNTARNLEEYSLIKPTLFEPDLLVGFVGNAAFTFDEQGNEVEETGYAKMICDMTDKDWDVRILIEEIEEEFEMLRSCKKVYNLNTVYFVFPEAEYINIQENVKKFVKNPGKEVRKARCMRGKLIISKQHNADGLFIYIHPITSGKHLAIQYGQLKFGFENHETIVAGDAMSDKEALNWPCPGVIVANSEESLFRWFHKKNRPNTYISKYSYADAVKEAVSLALGLDIN